MNKRIHKFITMLKTEREKLKSMTFPQKADYIFTYYKHVFVIFLLLCLIGFYVGDAIVQSSKDTMLLGFFPNDEWDLFNASELTNDYYEHFNLENNQNVYFEDDMYIDLDGKATEYTTASTSKVMAYMTTGELDFMVTPEYLFEYYNGSLPMYDFRELLPEDLLAKLEEYLVYVSPDDEHLGAYGLDITASRYIAGTDADKDPLIEDTYIMFVPYNAPRTDALVEYIRFLFDW